MVPFEIVTSGTDADTDGITSPLPGLRESLQRPELSDELDLSLANFVGVVLRVYQDNFLSQSRKYQNPTFE